ncbi:MAG: carboxypeptidase-like regulatory domain-containing protein, partial [Acidobacteria bacterium]|nr:carboxypeptidase-like regulatory domain-containing protein [Acidobacteriota bacterium]
MIRRAIIAVLLLLVFASLPAVSSAQTKPAPTGKLMITVVDQSRLVIPNATVTIVGIDDTTKKATIAPAKSSDKGVSTFEGLAPGRYAVSGEFPGFEIGAINDLRVKAGDNKGVLVLPMARLTEEITVGRDKQTVASDRGATFGSALTREQIDALSDDPTEMARQLQDMAGTGATMRVDSFEGAQLPPKAMIKAIHITRDSFAAE